MKRRRFLAAFAMGSGAIAGCSGNTEGDGSPGTEDSPQPPRRTTVGEQPPSETRTPAEGSGSIHVDPSGNDNSSGSESAPLKTVQAALDKAQPGDTISLRPGVYTGQTDEDRPVGQTVRDGEPGRPITITGPPEAIVRGPGVEMASSSLFNINHSHIHVVGLTLDGLLEPEQKGNHRWYRRNLVAVFPPTSRDSYLEDVKIKPHAIGNSRRKLIGAFRTNRLEIGDFELIGPAGVDYLHGDIDRYEIAEVVSLGISLNNIGRPHYPWEEPDQSHDVHVHHIANLAGYHHSELVKTHLGMYDVTVEYCTDSGGSGRENGGGGSVTVGSAQSKVRWCNLRNGRDHGVAISSPREDQLEALGDIPQERFPGVNNSIYGNQLLNNEGKAIAFMTPEGISNGPEDQTVLCGNNYDGETVGEPGRPCPDSVPESDQIGHLGGNSPFG